MKALGVLLAEIGIVLFVGGAIFYALWNSVMPDAFNLPRLTYMQAMTLWVMIQFSVIGSAFHKIDRRQSK